MILAAQTIAEQRASWIHVVRAGALILGSSVALLYVVGYLLTHRRYK